MDTYLDSLFDPVLSDGNGVSVSCSFMPNSDKCKYNKKHIIWKLNAAIYGKKLTNITWMHEENNWSLDPHSVIDWVYQMCSVSARSPTLGVIMLPLYRISHRIEHTLFFAFIFIILVYIYCCCFLGAYIKNLDWGHLFFTFSVKGTCLNIIIFCSLKNPRLVITNQPPVV